MLLLCLALFDHWSSGLLLGGAAGFAAAGLWWQALAPFSEAVVGAWMRWLATQVDAPCSETRWEFQLPKIPTCPSPAFPVDQVNRACSAYPDLGEVLLSWMTETRRETVPVFAHAWLLRFEQEKKDCQNRQTQCFESQEAWKTSALGQRLHACKRADVLSQSLPQAPSEPKPRF